MSDLPICECATVWPGEGHHPECPVRREIERLTARLEKEYERGDKSAQDAVNAQLDVNRLQARVEALEGVIGAINDYINSGGTLVITIKRIIQQDLAPTEQENKCAFCGSSEYPHICEGALNAFQAATEQENKLPWTDKDGNTQSSTLYGSGTAATEQGESDE